MYNSTDDSNSRPLNFAVHRIAGISITAKFLNVEFHFYKNVCNLDLPIDALKMLAQVKLNGSDRVGPHPGGTEVTRIQTEV